MDAVGSRRDSRYIVVAFDSGDHSCWNEESINNSTITNRFFSLPAAKPPRKPTLRLGRALLDTVVKLVDGAAQLLARLLAQLVNLLRSVPAVPLGGVLGLLVLPGSASRTSPKGELWQGGLTVLSSFLPACSADSFASSLAFSALPGRRCLIAAEAEAASAAMMLRQNGAPSGERIADGSGMETYFPCASQRPWGLRQRCTGSSRRLRRRRGRRGRLGGGAWLLGGGLLMAGRDQRRWGVNCSMGIDETRREKWDCRDVGRGCLRDGLRGT
jgi:hypothetical protein